jgi:hypothetical protein
MPLNLSQDVIDDYLKQLKVEFSKGQVDKLFAAIRFCGNEGVLMPEWVVDAFYKATNAWYSMRARTLDDAFGITPPTVKRLRAKQSRREKGLGIYLRVQEMHSDVVPINKTLFALVGKEFGIGSTVASECYTEMKQLHEEKNSFDKLLESYTYPTTVLSRTTNTIKQPVGRPRKNK